MGINVRIPGLARTALWALGLASAVVEPSFAASGEFADKAATFLAVFIIIVMPVGGIVLFWLVHVLPEKIAEKRHHPQKDAIHVLCLLSLVFGGLLWPLAWLWAYSKPVLHQLAYGRDKHEDYYAEGEGAAGDEAPSEAVQKELGQLRHDLEQLEKRGELPASTKVIRERVATLEGRLGSAATAGGDG
jgi:CBS domain containing-hemolysin-like protein